MFAHIGGNTEAAVFLLLGTEDNSEESKHNSYNKTNVHIQDDNSQPCDQPDELQWTVHT